MNQLANLAIRKYKVTLFLSLFIMAIGMYSFVVIPKQDMPEITPPLSTIQVIAPGYSINDVEEYVTAPLEEAILQIEGVDFIDSVTLDNIAILNVVLNIDETETKAIFDRVIAEVNAVSLPDGVQDPVFRNLIAQPHAVFGLSSETLSLEEMTAQSDRFVNTLKAVDNVARVSVVGESDVILYVDVDTTKLNQLGLSVGTFMNILNAGGLEIPIGSLVTEESSAAIRVPANYASIEDVNNIILGMNEMVPIRVSDVASVRLEENVESPIYTQNGIPTVFVEVYFDTGIDFTVLGDELLDVETVFDLQARELTVTRMTFQPDTVNASLQQVYSSLAIGIVLVLIVIFIGLGLKNALGVAFTFPLIIFGTIGAMFFLGQDLQKVTIAAIIIIIGIIVDNSIVISESIQYHLDEGLSKMDAAVESVKENSIPVLSSSLTTIAAFIPFMVIGGFSGKIIRSIPITVSIAIGLSYVVAMLVMPVIGALFFTPSKRKAVKEERKPSVFYTKVLPSIIKRPVLLLSGSILLLLGSLVFMGANSEIVLYPVDDENIIYVDYSFNDSTDQEAAHEYALAIIDQIERFDEVYYTAYSVGGDLPQFGALTQINNVPGEGRIFIRVDVPFNEVAEYVESIGLLLEDDAYIQDNGEYLVKQLTMNFGGDADAAVALSSFDYDLLMDNVDAVIAEFETLDSVAEIQVQEQRLQDNIIVSIDRQKLLPNGLTLIEVQQQISANLNGGTFAIYEHNGGLIDVKVQTTTGDLATFESMKIQNSQGQFIPLNTIATFDTTVGLQRLQRNSGDYKVWIDVYFTEEANSFGETTLLVEAAESVIDADVELSLGGQADLMNETFSTLGIAALFALLVVYFILFAQFDSFKTPFIILITVPLSLIGSGFLIGVTQTPISFTSIFGVTSLIGIVVNMGILLIDYINRARAEGQEVLDACVSAVQRRLRPILLSSVTTIMGLVPLVIYGGAFFTPMAVSLMGGLIASTILTIFIIPSAYYLLER